MTTLLDVDHAARSDAHADVRVVVRSVAVLGVSLALTVGVLVALSSVVGTWA